MILGIFERVAVPATQIVPIYAPLASLSFNPRDRYGLGLLVKIDFQKAPLRKVNPSFDRKSFSPDVYRRYEIQEGET